MPNGVLTSDPQADFTERDTWSRVGEGWRQLYGSFEQSGISFEAHEFTGDNLDWATSFHPDSIEVCLNLGGRGELICKDEKITVPAQSVLLYRQGNPKLKGWRRGREAHSFITIEFSAEFLRRHLGTHAGLLHPLAAKLLGGDRASGVSRPEPLRTEHQQLIQTLLHPPVGSAAQQVWYASKALEIAALFLFKAPTPEELFCDRQKRLSLQRVEKVISLLRENLAEPPTLEDLGKKVGCSHFYLSRIFSKEVGMTIPQYLRKMRMEKAAELLRGGKHNVTQAALEVGYNSLSHFSTAFHQTYGCCPGLYPFAPGHGQ